MAGATLTQRDRDWLNALWAQAERDAAAEWRQMAARAVWGPSPFPFEPLR